MNKIDELQAQRNELFNHSSDTLARIKEFDKQIAKESKPKLRHGDYGTSRTIGHKWVHLHGDTIWIEVEDNTHPSSFKEAEFIGGVLGNIFDDLTAIQEDVESFENRGTTFRLNANTGEVVITTPRGVGYVDLLSVAPFIRQMQATYKRKEAKK